MRRLLLPWLIVLPLLAQAEPRDDARRLFLEGLAAAERGNYSDAISRFLSAQEIYPHPATVFNIARAYEDQGELRKALHWYRIFEAEVPEQAADVATAIVQLKERLTTPMPLPPSPEAAAPTAEDGLRARITQLEQLVGLLREQLADQPPGPARARPASAAPPPQQPAPRRRDDAFKTNAYERVVTTSSRYGQSPLDSPSTITVLTAEDLRLSGATSVADALRRVPGVDLMAFTVSNPSVAIRGFNTELSNKVLWLVDGRPVSWSFLATPFALNLPVAMEEIDRIEVIRGPASALYGADAFTGVVNILTREPGSTPAQTFSVSAGYPDFLQATALSSGSSGDVGWRVSAGYDQEGRWEKDGAVGPGSSLEAFVDDQDLGARKGRANARLDYRFADKGLASLSGGYTQGLSEFTNLGALGSYGLEGRTHYVRGDLGYDPVSLRAFWNHERVRTGPWTQPVDTPRDLHAELRSDVVDVEAVGDFLLTQGRVTNRFVLGAGYRYKCFQFDYLLGGYDTPAVEHHGQVFFQDELRVDWFGLVGALRLDLHPLIPVADTFSPRGSLVFRVADRTSLRVGGGTGFRAPSAVESYLDFELPTSADGAFVRELGSQASDPVQTLRPEQLITAELGVHDESSVFHAIDATVYWNRVTRLVTLRDVEAELQPYDEAENGYAVGNTGFVNSGLTYDAFGGELEVEVFPTTGLDVFANLALQRIFEDDGEERVIDRSTSFVKVNAGVLYRAPFHMSFGVVGHYVGPQAWRLRDFDEQGLVVVTTEELPARWLLSARIGGKPFPGRDIELSATLFNPLGFGPRFREHPKGQLVGPRVYGNVTFSF